MQGGMNGGMMGWGGWVMMLGWTVIILIVLGLAAYGLVRLIQDAGRRRDRQDGRD